MTGMPALDESTMHNLRATAVAETAERLGGPHARQLLRAAVETAARAGLEPRAIEQLTDVAAFIVRTLAIVAPLRDAPDPCAAATVLPFQCRLTSN